MVVNAPSFSEVAAHIHSMLQGKVFIAHNVNFDYSFVKHHLSINGFSLEEHKLCTVRLARKVLPGMRSYALGKLCFQLGIPHYERHRAGGDASATAHLFKMIFENEEAAAVMEMMLKGKNKESYLPPHLPVDAVENLPHGAGVYYFCNAAGKVVYVGKAKNIYKRVKSHFSNNKTNRQKQDFLRDIHKVTFRECATELMAHILESAEIRRLWPVHNRSQRGYLASFGLFVYEDQGGYKRLLIEKTKPHFKPVYSFNTMMEGHERLRALIAEFELCPRLCNLSKTADCEDAIAANNCTGNCKEIAAQYNLRIDEAINWLHKQLPTFAFLDRGLKADEKSCILVSQGNFYGMGYISEAQPLKNADALRQQLEPLQDNDFIRNLIYKHAAANPQQCQHLA